MNEQQMEFKTMTNTLNKQVDQLIHHYKTQYPDDETLVIISVTSLDSGKTSVVFQCDMGLDNVRAALVQLNQRLIKEVVGHDN